MALEYIREIFSNSVVKDFFSPEILKGPLVLDILYVDM